jgi:phenylpropionate dioxygenase-like ring-hydroxylating dioxygenase large terminal subunit
MAGSGLTSAPAAGAFAGKSKLSSRFPFTPYPTGWYRVAAGRELGPDQVRPLRCFGRDLVLFRSKQTVPVVLDAHCPHLGAHLGHGGRVIDGSIVCPFHGWRFSSNGACVGVPNASIVPSRARLGNWAVRAVNGAIMVWFDEAGRQPIWEVPELPEWQSAGWTRFRPTRSRRVRTHVQELAENGVDLAHFPAIHGGQVARIESAGLKIDRETLTHLMRNSFASRISRNTHLLGLTADRRTGPPGQLEFTYHGLGTMICRATVAGRFPVSFVTVLYFLPTDDEFVEVTGELAIRRCGVLTLPLLALAVRETERAIAADTAILENKLYVNRPQLGDADGPIMQYRKWAQQFYTASVPVLAAVDS